MRSNVVSTQHPRLSLALSEFGAIARSTRDLLVHQDAFVAMLKLQTSHVPKEALIAQNNSSDSLVVVDTGSKRSL